MRKLRIASGAFLVALLPYAAAVGDVPKPDACIAWEKVSAAFVARRAFVGEIVPADAARLKEHLLQPERMGKVFVVALDPDNVSLVVVDKQGCTMGAE